VYVLYYSIVAISPRQEQQVVYLGLNTQPARRSLALRWSRDPHSGSRDPNIHTIGHCYRARPVRHDQTLSQPLRPCAPVGQPTAQDETHTSWGQPLKTHRGVSPSKHKTHLGVSPSRGVSPKYIVGGSAPNTSYIDAHITTKGSAP